MKFVGLKVCCFLLAVYVGNCLPDGDLCKWMNGRKYYIDVGESGIISVENATSVTKGVEPSSPTHTQPQIPQRCSVELITCPSCHLEITIQKLHIPTCSNDKTCRCDFLWIKESAYSKSGREYCGTKGNGTAELIYESKTKLVSVDFLFSGSYDEAFSLQFSAKKNVYIYNGKYDYFETNSSGLIKSPNFPGGYPSDYSAEYIIQNVDQVGYVQLIFTDFQLSLWSFVEIFDTNGSRIDVYNGNTFRPPAITSSGPTLTVKFQANDEYPSTGFQARYTFVSYPEKHWINRPSTDCGGFVEDFGGAITMMNMVPVNTVRAFDCIWLIRPRNSHVPDTQVAIRVAQFEEMGPKSALTIRQGQHSDAPVLESVTTYQHHKMPRGQEFVVPATSGFYIRLVGYFTNKSHLAIIYTTFRYEGCYATSDFECDNGRCVKTVLRCDGFNHCGDGSDEAACYGTNIGTAVPEDANWWRTLTPNYYFPKSESSSGAGTNTLILVTSLAGLGMFVLTTVMILVKLHRQRHDDTISREILHTISADLDTENSPGHHIASDLPHYDPPPSYEDVIKHYLPPPPPYSAINKGRNRNSRPNRGGVENRAYRNDSPNGVRIHTRRQRAPHRVAPQESNHPLILKVVLPEEDMTSPVSIRRDRTVTSDAPNCTSTMAAPPYSVEDPQKTFEFLSSSIDNNHGSDMSTVVMPQTNSSHQENNLSSRVQLACDCEGACSCQLINNRKQVTRCSSESKATIVSGSDSRRKTEKPSVSKKRSFKDLIQKGMSRSSSSAIIPHPASMTITIHPPKSKESENEEINAKSKSAGPSSPTDPSPPYYEKDPKTSIDPMMGLRRVSSNPSDVSVSMNYIADIPIDKNAIPCHKSVSENQILAEKPIKQVKNLASVLLDGLQQSFNFKSEEPSSVHSSMTKDDDNSIVPANWTNLLIPSRKRTVEPVCVTENGKSEKTWTASADTLPLLTGGSQQPEIRKLEGSKLSQSYSSDIEKASND